MWEYRFLAGSEGGVQNRIVKLAGNYRALPHVSIQIGTDACYEGAKP